jgi:hypothetical protein
MLFQTYLRQGIVYVPTTAKRGTSVYTTIEPVAVVPVSDTNGLRRALLDTINRKNITVPLLKGKRPPPILLKYAGVKTWSTFARNTLTWDIIDDGIYQIVGHKIHPKGYWVEDANQRIKFPAGSTVDEVIDRMIAILQDAASRP